MLAYELEDKFNLKCNKINKHRKSIVKKEILREKVIK